MGKIGIEAVVAIGIFGHVDEEIAGADKVALGLDSILFDFRGDHAIGYFCVVDAVITAFDVTGKVLADKAIEQGTQYILLKIPSIDSTAYLVGNGPDLTLQGGALLNACHVIVPF
ncbi:hypothetical protein D3C72_1879570 [compost metagenome]